MPRSIWSISMNLYSVKNETVVSYNLSYICMYKFFDRIHCAYSQARNNICVQYSEPLSTGHLRDPTKYGAQGNPF